MGRGKDGPRFHTGEQNTNFVSTLVVTNFATLTYVLLSYLVTDTYFQLENIFKSAAFRSNRLRLESYKNPIMVSATQPAILFINI